jgi:hypothetical protein
MRITILLFLAICFSSGCAPAPRFTELPPPTTAPHLLPIQFEGGLVQSGPHIYVVGEVRHPGRYAWTNGISRKDAIYTAGGLTDFAGSTIRLSRSQGSPQDFNVKGFATNNPTLNPGDAVYIGFRTSRPVP